MGVDESVAAVWINLVTVIFEQVLIKIQNVSYFPNNAFPWHPLFPQ